MIAVAVLTDVLVVVSHTLSAQNTKINRVKAVTVTFLKVFVAQ